MCISHFKQGTGSSVDYYPSGQKKYELSFVREIQHGACTWWHENGQMKMNADYVNGTVESSKCWDKEGKPLQCPEQRD